MKFGDKALKSISFLTISFFLFFVEASEAQVEVTLWHSLGGRDQGTFQQLVSEFNRSGDCNIVTSFRGNPNETYSQVIAAFRAGESPTIVQLSDYFTGQVPEFVYPLKDLHARYGLDVKQTIRDFGGQFVSADGTHSAIPITASTPTLWINTSIFEEFGLGEITTWEELRNAGLQLKDSGIETPLVASWPMWTLVEGYAARQNVPLALNGEWNLTDERILDHTTRLSEFAESGILHFENNSSSGLGSGCIDFRCAA